MLPLLLLAQLCSSTKTLTVMVFDECEDCAANQLNLQAVPFTSLAPTKAGQVAIQFREVRVQPTRLQTKAAGVMWRAGHKGLQFIWEHETRTGHLQTQQRQLLSPVAQGLWFVMPVMSDAAVCMLMQSVCITGLGDTTSSASSGACSAPGCMVPLPKHSTTSCRLCCCAHRCPATLVPQSL